jgi:putative membrane protein
MMWGYWNNGGLGWMGWLGMGIGMLINLAIVGLIIYLVVRAFSKDGFRDTHTNYSNSAVQILKERFAKGEIDEEEYNKRMDVINRK